MPDKYRGPIRAALDKALKELPNLPPPVQDSLVSYLAMIANIDENMGRLEAFLKDSGLRENTILIFLTDNGSTMGPRYYNAGMRGGKVTLWEGGHRVPCFIRWPEGGLINAQDIGEMTEVQDLLPTLIDLCQLNPANTPKFDGASLAGLLRGETMALPDRMLVVDYSRMPGAIAHPSPDSPSVPKREGAAVLWKRWRLLEDKELYNLEDDFAQEKNVIEQYPEVAAKMSAHLDQWWGEVEKSAKTPRRVIVGSNHENPSMLTACEWLDVFVDQQAQVRTAQRKNGIWHLEAAAPGRYTFELRRWPAETRLPLTAGMPATKVTGGTYPAGEALPIHAARIEAAGQAQSKTIAPEDQAASFTLELKKGPFSLQTWFDDAGGREICGAYYVYVTRETK